jgi:hypothetical protein
MNSKTRLICLVVGIVLGSLSLTTVSTIEDDAASEGHEFFMNIEEPYQEIRTTSSSDDSELTTSTSSDNDFDDDFEPRTDQDLYDRLLTSDLNIPVVNLDFKRLRRAVGGTEHEDEEDEDDTEGEDLNDMDED